MSLADEARKALQWLTENDPEGAEELSRAMLLGDDEDVLELVAGCPDRVTGREPIGGQTEEGRW